MENQLEKKRCAACRQPFQPRPQAPEQVYCSASSCQRERRRRWQCLKRQTDPDYQDNQARAQQAWSQRHPDYWRKYRESHPEYVERNRAMQHERNAKAISGPIAKMDASIPETPLLSGTYQLRLVTESGIAKMDVWTAEITVLARQSVNLVEIAKR